MTLATDDPQVLLDLLNQFMEQHVYPAETLYHEQLNALEDRFSTVPLMEDLKAKAKAAAALEGITLKDLVIKAIKEYLKKKDR